MADRRLAQPGAGRERAIRDRHAARGREKGRPKVRRVRVARVVPKRRIASDADLEEALDALRKAVANALSDAEAVELE